MAFLKKITSMLKSFKNPALIIESDEVDQETGLIFFWLKFEGKCTALIKSDPIALLKESRSKNCFSEADHDRILEALLENQKRLTENKYRKKYFLKNHQFSEQLKEPLLVYNDIHNKIHIKSAKEIYKNLDALKQFSPEDSACIGYLIGSHEAEQEYKIHKNNKKNNVIKFDTSLLSG